MLTTFMTIFPIVKADVLTLTIGPVAVDESWGGYDQWIFSDVSLVDDVFSDDSAYIYTSVMSMSAYFIEYYLQNHTTETGTIINVTLSALIEIQGGPLDLTFAVMEPGTGDSQNKYIYDVTGDQQLYSQSFDTDWDSENWTWETIDDLEYYFSVTDTENAGDVYVDQFYVTVFYEPEPALVDGWWDEITRHADWSARCRHTSVVYDDKMWVMGGYDSSDYNDVWYSTDGANWTEATADAEWSERQYPCSVVYDDKMWIMGGLLIGTGSFNDVWYSTDGATWTEANASAAWSNRTYSQVLNYSGKMWLLGGTYDLTNSFNDVWYSTDGDIWTQATASADWAPRFLTSALVYDDKMWVFGGTNETGFRFNDVWYSTDGIDWTEATASAAWSGRIAPAVTFDDKMCILGGIDGGNETWYSTDGVTWTEDNNTAEWAERYLHTAVTYGDKMWVLGGAISGVGAQNDVWNTNYTTMDEEEPEPDEGGPTDTINVTLTPGATANISVTPPTWDGENASIGQNASTATDYFTLDNIGTVQVDVTIIATNTSAWTLAGSPAHNQFQLQYGVGTGGGGSPASLTLRPNGNGFENEWTSPTNATTWEAVDDVIIDYSTTMAYWYGTDPPGRDYYNIQDHTTETGIIDNVTVYACVYGDHSAYTEGFRFMIYNNSAQINSTQFEYQNDWTNFSYIFTTNPSGSSWDWGDIDALQVGIECDDWFDGGAMVITQYYVVVHYTTAGGGGATWTNITTSPASFVNNFAYDASQDFGLKVFMPTSTSTNTAQSSTITFSATAD